MTHTHSFHKSLPSIESAIEKLNLLQQEAHQLSQRSTLEPYELERLQQLHCQIHNILQFVADFL